MFLCRCSIVVALVFVAGKGALSTEPASPWVRRFGRSIYSTNPKESANFFLRYFVNAVADGTNHESAILNKSVVRVPMITDGLNQSLTLTFAQAPLGTSESDPRAAVDSARMLWLGATGPTHTPAYGGWIDNHDGFQVLQGKETIVNFTRLLADDVPYLLYADVLRIQVPNTTYTVEIFQQCGRDAASCPLKKRVHNPDLCRNNSKPEPFPDNTWFKATFASSDLAASSNFMGVALGAEPTISPYPWPPQKGCVETMWRWFPGRPMMIHFVDSTWAYPFPEGEYSVAEWVQGVEAAGLPAQRYAGGARNTFDVEVDDVAIIAQRLIRANKSYVVHEEEGKCVLYSHIDATGFCLRAVSDASVGGCSHDPDAIAMLI